MNYFFCANLHHTNYPNSKNSSSRISQQNRLHSPSQTINHFFCTNLRQSNYPNSKKYKIAKYSMYLTAYSKPNNEPFFLSRIFKIPITRILKLIISRFATYICCILQAKQWTIFSVPNFQYSNYPNSNKILANHSTELSSFS
jgi:hypothetical protein